MTKTIMILAIAAAFVVGSIATGTIAFADDDDELSSLLCDAGKAMTGIVFGDDDDGSTQIFCAEIAVNDADSDPKNELQTLVVREPFKSVTVPAGSSKILAVKCNSDEVLSGGGVKANGAGKAFARYIDSGSGLDGLTYVGQVIHDGPKGSASFDLQVIAECLKLK